MKTIIEPFRIKMTEPIRLNNRAEREIKLKEAHYNVFLLDAEDCPIDLLTDSGTGAMSAKQWGALMMGDESYAGSKSFKNFHSVVHEITGMPHIFPTHQGRAAESLLALTRVKPGNVIPNNSHFDTTRANMEFAGGKALDLPCPEAHDTGLISPFKGNMDLDRLKAAILEYRPENIPFVMVTVTNNTGGGQPVSMTNLKGIRAVCDEFKLPLILDCCRFAENAYFINRKEEGYQDRSLISIAQEMFSLVDGATMSCKKDGLANIGGFFVCRNEEWAEDFKNALILREGFPSYGGLAGRDLEVIAVGLKEALEYEYQNYRHATVKYLGERLEQRGIPYVKPVGGHAVFLDAKKILPQIPPLLYPGISLVNALYLEGGVRVVELGTVMFGRRDARGNELPAPLELVRLAFPRRVYTQSHFDYLAEVIDAMWSTRDQLKGYRITYQPKFLRHFSCKFEPLD